MHWNWELPNWPHFTYSPALGNIYEGSSMSKKVIWLPAANDSQGQQLQLLRQHGMADYFIDWADIFELTKPINYFDSQDKVMKEIAYYMKRLSDEPLAQERFKMLLWQNFQQTEKTSPPHLGKLVETFEVYGTKMEAETILQWLDKTVFSP